ncbi:MAG: OmpH family outer membrane protein [Bacteroidetes bacterium]|uniref:OmpH family outer membrane protein n=1 Tax=Phaeocystidibacter marisrubri TaxID=1577780 RepID=A0A6L3ZF25_9FLAO|nr:OmpH family outer membrane protein [Phaeocystidibacter marisrubri]KAB2815280.1 OmpH family outer membrane protein [Phaeocystidibacter marisrubri]TNE31552.1 MAG: OmpH family outer membrane protein [Bacteroidota bacterium]GGH71280.1 membrane protein [Phaeocystidibacter marisrubri]
MRTKLLILFFALFTAVSAYGQRFGYVDTQYILEQIPEYGQAQREIDRLSTQWAGEIEALQSEADGLQQAFEAERILLTEEMQTERQANIDAKRKEARELQIKYFGPQGELFKKRAELVKPIQDQVYNAVREVSRRRKLDFMFDKNGSVTMLYANDDNDFSDDVLRELGY